MVNEILVVKGLSFRFGRNLILDKIDLKVFEGELLGIVGISGVGKTTLLNSIIGFYPVPQGQISYNGSKAGISQKQLFGFSAQNQSYYPELTVLENIRYFASLYSTKNDSDQSIKKALELVDLTAHQDVIAKNLSGGMKKRLDIACAIVHSPKILILDEPTSDMDPLLRVQIWEVIEDINRKGTTIIVASHFLTELEHTCDRIALMNNKKIEYIGTPKDFRNQYSKVKEIHIATSDGDYDLILKKLRSIPILEVKYMVKRKGGIVIHSEQNEKTIRDALHTILKNQVNVSDIEIMNPSFDTLFNRFVKK